MKKFKVISIAVIIFLSVVSIFQSIILANYKQRVAEVAFSFCGEAILGENVNEKEVINYLTFTDLPQKHIEIIQSALKISPQNLDSVAKKMILFEYTEKNLKELLSEIENSAYVQTVVLKDEITAEEFANILIKKVFKGGVDFKEESGDGNNYLKRYYCGNICIDVLDEYTIRYLSNVEAVSKEDLFYNWLLDNSEYDITVDNRINGLQYKEIIAESFFAKLYIIPEIEKILSAEITLKR